MRLTTNTHKINRELPALAQSLRDFKRSLVKDMRERAQRCAHPRMREAMYDKVRKVEALRPAQLRADYTSVRAAEIRRNGTCDLAWLLRKQGKTFIYL
jgi:hypothetical protein